MPTADLVSDNDVVLPARYNRFRHLKAEFRCWRSPSPPSPPLEYLGRIYAIYANHPWVDEIPPPDRAAM